MLIFNGNKLPWVLYVDFRHFLSVIFKLPISTVFKSTGSWITFSPSKNSDEKIYEASWAASILGSLVTCLGPFSRFARYSVSIWLLTLTFWNISSTSHDWRVMVAVPKEREFKEDDARCYGKMTPEMRAYQVVTEKNIADVIFRYIKHQYQLLRTLFRMSHPGEAHDYVNIIIDFSSWCTHFRAELLAPLFCSLDKLFGFKQVYRFTHMFPLLSHLLFQDRYKPPDQDSSGNPMDGPRCVRGPEAWLEGLRQKGWTLATILIILIAAYKCDTTASLLGQGDNQVIVLRIPSA